MHPSIPIPYRIGRALVRGALGFYFARIERFHRERVPLTGPVLFASNHPNSLTDAFVIGTSVPRKVNFVATVQMFQFAAARWVLRQCGVIPVNRLKDDPRAMRTVVNTFAACHRVLEAGEAVGIFPEGITHDDPQLKNPKTGAARMALELEDRHGGTLGLRIVPVGLTFPAKDSYRSTALVSFGEPIRVAGYLAGYGQNRHQGIQALHAEVQHRIEGLMVHLPHLERARVVAAVKRLYLDRLRVANTVIHEPVSPEAGELLLTQAIAAAVEAAFEKHPARAAKFVERLDRYEKRLARLHLSDEVLAHFPERDRLLLQGLAWAALAVLGAPFALYGWLHRLIPYAILRWVGQRTAKRPVDRTHVSTTAVLVGLLVFAPFYAACMAVFHLFFGWPATFWYALSLPLASLLGHYYWREMRRFGASLRVLSILLRAPALARHLLAERAALIELIAAERVQLREEQTALKGG